MLTTALFLFAALLSAVLLFTMVFYVRSGRACGGH